jgi:hypothetical protein
VPALARFGTLILLVGLLADVAVHVLAAETAAAHLLTFIGMLVVVGSVAAQGARAGNAAASRSASHHALR